MANRFFCAGCRGTFFYQRGAMVHCSDCDKLYSAPSKNELNAMRDDEIFEDPSTLKYHYEHMRVLDQFIAGVKHRRPSKDNGQFKLYTDNMMKIRNR